MSIERKAWIFLITFCFLLLSVSVCYAGGDRQIETKTADGIEIWRTEFDVSGRKPGTYNIIINAKDAAGNIGVGGPYNIKVDRMAGLPEARVVYPLQDMVVRGDVEIVGTTDAPYGLQEVLISIDGAAYAPLSGLEYWDYRIPAEEIKEGRHTIRVKAVDVQGLEGPESRVDFILDNLEPEIELLSHQPGDIIVGTVTVRGMVSDVNGIRSVSLSKDGGKTFTKLSHRGGKKGDYARYFRFNITSKRRQEGSLVYYIRAVNTTGVSVTRPVLFYVNNKAPVIEVMSPSEEEDVYGYTQVTGRVISPIGLTQFYFEWPGDVDTERAGVREGKEGGRLVYHIPLRPGDQFWSCVIFFSLSNSRPVPFKVTAIDKSGNKTELVKRFHDRRKYRTPMHVIDNPPPPKGLVRMQLEWDEPIYGHILEGYFGDFIVNDSYVGQASAKPSFRIPPEMIPTGSNTIQLYAMDEDEALGPKLSLRINKAEAPPGARIRRSPIRIESPHKGLMNFTFDGIEENDQAEDHPWVGDLVTVSGEIEGYREGNLLEYRLRWDMPWNKVEVAGNGRFSVLLDLTRWPPGPVPLEMRTIREGGADYPLYLAMNRYVKQPEITFMTPHERFGRIEHATTASGIIDYHVPIQEISYTIDDGVEYKELEFTRKYGRAWFNEYIDFTDVHVKGQWLTVRVIDRAGNIATGTPDYVFDNSSSSAKIIHNVPQDGDVVSGDFEISGLAYTDVGVTAVHWRILSPQNPWDSPAATVARNAGVEFNRIDTAQNYRVFLTLADVKDGENVLEIYADDFYGVPGVMVSKTFMVNKAAPQVEVKEPARDFWNRGDISVSGTAYDNNGISEVAVSMDQGLSYQRAEVSGSQSRANTWSITLNTEAYRDGQYSMLIRAEDKYGQQTYTNAIINIDNSAPLIDLVDPENGATVGRTLYVNGHIYDNLKVETITIHLADTNNPNVYLVHEAEVRDVLMEELDVRSYRDGDYTMTITTHDMSGNETVEIRNVTLLKAKAASELALINPLPGIANCGTAVVSGRISGAVIPQTVDILLDRRKLTEAAVNKYGVFRFELPDTYGHQDGVVAVSAAFQTPSGEWVASHENMVHIKKYGPVLEIRSHRDGDVITGRPWLSGEAYMFRPEDEKVDRRTRVLYGVERVELSFDNGRSFAAAKGTGEWKYRLETSEMEMGILPIIIKAVFNNGETAVRRLLLIVDTQRPRVTTIGPQEMKEFRDAVTVFGSTRDNYDMDSVEVSLRPGNKVWYSVPGFIQGLYIDASFMGGLNWTTGLGLTFFEDNVKLQFNVSQAPSGRYSGWAYGGKVLANIYTKNMGEWLGLDWTFWRTSITLGAHFSYFLMEEDETPVWMGQFLGQWEVMKADMSYFFPKWKYFKTFSFYAETGVWFAPSDVTYDANAWRTLFVIGFGGRVSLF
jgi:hypothetical protein